MDRLRAFAVVLSAAVTVIVASALALPVSSTHIALGAVFGVGFLREYLENQAGKVRAIRALYDDYREPKLFDTPRSEIRSLRAAVEDLNRGLPDETIRRQLAHLTEKAERAVEEWQAVKLVRRSHLRTIVAAWLVTVPATAGFAAVVYFVLSAVPLPGIAD
jgi:PiT family inorganic phosphate transporter